jgi:hypothetical protein
MRAMLSTLAIVVLALVGLTVMTTPSSATVLCGVEPFPGHDCVEDEVYAGGTEFTAILKSALKFKSGESTLVECSGSELSLKNTSEGSAESNVGVSVAAASFSGCSTSLEAQNLPWEGGTITWTSETSNGTMSVSSLRLKTTLFGVSCVYGGLSTSTLKGGEPAALVISTTVSRVSGGFLCPTSVTAQGEYQVTKKTEEPLFVAQKPRGIKFCADKTCTTEYKFPTESELRAKLSKEAEFQFKYSKVTTTVKCKVSEFRTPFTTAFAPTVATTTMFEFDTCNRNGNKVTVTPFTAKYRMELDPQRNGDGLATVRAETNGNPFITITEPGVFTCEYETVSFGIGFFGGGPAEMPTSSTLNDVTSGGSKGKCEGAVTLTATWEVTLPKSLWIF